MPVNHTIPVNRAMPVNHDHATIIPEHALEAISQQNRSTGELIERKIRNNPLAKETIGKILKQTWSSHTASMAAAMLAHALAISDPPTYITKIRTIKNWRTAIIRSRDPEHDRVLPIALGTLEQIGHGAGTVLNRAARTARIVRAHLDQGHDLTGQSLQNTILDRKDLASYHTRPTTASFMAHLAVPTTDELHKLAGPRRAIRIIDPACGAGILLQATADAVRTRFQEEQEVQAASPQPELNTVLTGFDILPANVALTAATLSQLTNTSLNVRTLHYGPTGPPEPAGPTGPSGSNIPRPVALGALDLLDPNSPTALTQARRDPHMKARGQHIVIMNPPFTKNPSQQATDRNTAADSSATTPEELELMANRTADLARRLNAQTSNGLPFLFANLALQLVGPGGTIALLLPMTALSSAPRDHGEHGEQPAGWHLFRQYIARDFTEVTVVSLAQYERQKCAFSHDTDIAEVIIVARKRTQGDLPPPAGKNTGRFISLTAAPQDDEEAQAFASIIRNTPPTEPVWGETPAVQPLTLRGAGIGTQVIDDLSKSTWSITGVLDPRIHQATHHIRRGHLARNARPRISGPSPARLPMTTILKLGSQAPTNPANRTDFRIDRGKPEPPSFAFLDSRNPGMQKSILVTPRHSATAVTPLCKSNPDPRDHAATLQINNSHRYNSQALPAAATTDPCLAGPHWSTVRMDDDVFEKATALWMNTTIGLVSQWSMANQTQPGKGYISHTQTGKLPTLDLRELTTAQLSAMMRIFRDLAPASLMPASDAWRDPVRIELDRRVLEEALDLRDNTTISFITWLRNSWCREPSVQSRKGKRQIHQDSMAELAEAVRQSDLALERAPQEAGQPHRSPPASAAISPQLLRTLAEILEQAEDAPPYRELTLSTHPDGIALTVIRMDGRRITDLPNLQNIPYRMSKTADLVLEQT